MIPTPATLATPTTLATLSRPHSNIGSFPLVSQYYILSKMILQSFHIVETLETGGSKVSTNTPTRPYIDDDTFHADVQYIESLWQRTRIGTTDMPLIDIGKGEPLVFVPILEHLEFVYTRQIQAFSKTRRVIMYRRHETRTHPLGLVQRAEELRQVLDSLGLEAVDLVAHGDAAMVLFEFAARYPQRCRSLVIIAQGADYEIAPHPFIWLLHELFVRLPIEHFLPAWFLRRLVINYIMAPKRVAAKPIPSLPRHLIEEHAHSPYQPA